MYRDNTIAVVIPTYKARDSIVDVVDDLPQWVDHIVVVDDKCPQQSGEHLKQQARAANLTIVYHDRNLGVGGATISGYEKAIDLGCDIVVKIDSDGQMDTKLLPYFLDPIVEGRADYCKGNRFYRPESLTEMPAVRVIGNAGLSFFSKMSSGYWDLMDPTNGYTAIHVNILENLPLGKISKRFFFESDLLFRLSTIRAKVVDIPIDSQYGTEESNISIPGSLFSFFWLHINRAGKRIFYNYFLRNFSIASLLLAFGTALLTYGLVSGLSHYFHNQALGQATPTGTIIIVTISILTGFQMLLAFISLDISNKPQMAIHPQLSRHAGETGSPEKA